MKKASLSVITAFVFFAAAALAQTSSTPDATGSQGTQSASPSQTSPSYSPSTPSTSTQDPSAQGSSSQGTGMGSSSTSQESTGANSQGAGNTSGSMGGMKNDNGMKNESGMKGEKKLKGCIQSSGGQYMLEEKKGKMVSLSSSQDLSAHVGHMVAVHGTWAGSGSSDMSSTSSSSGSAAGSAHTFNVSSIDMISDSCNGSKGKHEGGNMGSGNAGSSAQPQ